MRYLHGCTDAICKIKKRVFERKTIYRLFKTKEKEEWLITPSKKNVILKKMYMKIE